MFNFVFDVLISLNVLFQILRQPIQMKRTLLELDQGRIDFPTTGTCPFAILELMMT